MLDPVDASAIVPATIANVGLRCANPTYLLGGSLFVVAEIIFLGARKWIFACAGMTLSLATSN